MIRIHGMPFGPGRARGAMRVGLEGARAGEVLVLAQREIRPLDFRPEGLILVGGAPLSHPMLHLLALGIPMVVITPDQAADLDSGTEVMLDGAHGLVYSPDQAQYEETPDPVAPTRYGESYYTADREPVQLRASIDQPAEAREALSHGASAIGIVRTEYIAPDDGSAPNEAYYEDAFRKICEAAHPLPVRFRLLDLSNDKHPDWLPRIEGMEGLLGLQGSRLYDTEPVRSAFRAQVRVLGRLAQDHDVSALVPYVVFPEEFHRWRYEIERASPNPLRVGAMAETPAAALSIRDWLEEADFVSIGCNDLMQCLFGADRDNEAVAHYLDPYAPVLHRFLHTIAEQAGERVGEIQLCGFLPKVPGMLPMLIGQGFRAFSVEPHLIPYLAQALERVNLDTAQALAQAVCTAEDSTAARTLLGLTESPRRRGKLGGLY